MFGAVALVFKYLICEFATPYGYILAIPDGKIALGLLIFVCYWSKAANTGS